MGSEKLFSIHLHNNEFMLLFIFTAQSAYGDDEKLDKPNDGCCRKPADMGCIFGVEN